MLAITIDEDPSGGIRVASGRLVARSCGPDEALWCVVALLIRGKGPPPYLRPAIDEVRADLKIGKKDVRAYFAPPDFDFESWL